MVNRQYLERLSRELVDEGKLIEAGWVSLRITALPADAPAVQLEEMRNAFFAGAQHLFTSIMAFLDVAAGDEPTEDDLRRMTLIDAELQAFINDYSLRRLPSEGRA